MLQTKKGRPSIHTPGTDRGRFGRGKQYRRRETSSESHLPQLPRDPAIQTEADADLHKKAKSAMRTWLREQGTTLTTLLKKKRRKR